MTRDLVVKTELPRVVAGLPLFVPLTDLGARHFDLILGVGGFEVRSVAALDVFRREGTTADTVLIVKYGTNEPENDRALRDWEGWASRHSFDILDAAVAARSLRERVQTLSSDGAPNSSPLRILVDISVASNRLVVALVSELLDFAKHANRGDRGLDVDLFMHYVEAESYHPKSGEDVRSYDTASGVAELEVSVLEKRLFEPDLPTHLVMVPGWDAARVARMIEEAGKNSQPRFDAERDLTWLFGIPHHDSEGVRLQMMREKYGARLAAASYDVDTFDYTRIMLRLEALYQQHGSSHNFVVGLLGSKLQAFGAAMLAHCRPGVSIMGATPRNYRTTAYSEGVGPSFLFRCRSLLDLQDLLSSVDTLEIK